MFHTNHAVIIDQVQKVIVASADTDVFMCLMYHFRHWSMYELEELWVINGQGNSSRAVPVHNLVRLMKSGVVDVLPAVHALSGCDTTSKVGTKKSALQTAEETGHEQLHSFGKLPLLNGMVSAAEKFLVDCVSTSDKVDTFDELRFQKYHKKNFQVDFEKLPCTSKSIRLHIRRAYLQCYRWIHVASMENIDLSPIDYGYSVDEDDHLVHEILDGDTIPSDLPSPCNCLKCAKSTVCPFKIKQIRCCEFCKCDTVRDCKNPAK